MNKAQTSQSPVVKPLRLWPGVLSAVLVGLFWIGVPLAFRDAQMVAMLGGLAGALSVLIWWLFFSHAPWFERLGAIALMMVGVAAAYQVVHKSIATGMMGMMLILYAVPVLSMALVAWATAARRLPNGARRASLMITILATCSAFTLLRTDGIFGEGGSDLHWRWTPSAEEQLLAQPPPKPMAEPPLLESPETVATWPGFRGAQRNAIVTGVLVETNWAQTPPKQLWRSPVGPGWSSFAIHGSFFYTQEQRGEDEAVSCYKLKTGEPVWQHLSAARFWESNAGAGPRATPTFSQGRIYALGATGILHALDARTGSLIWSRNVASDTNTKIPGWGFAGSPLQIGTMVVVAAAGKLAAYDIATGEPRWVGPAHGGSYSSPHEASLSGVHQILLMSNSGITSVSPAEGTVLWEHEWQGGTIIQPALTAEGNILISTSGATGGIGVRLLAVNPEEAGWNVEERWTSRDLKPYFNDMVAHKGHAYGFDGSMLACVNLQDGKRAWKGGRYGRGQLLLMTEQNLLLVVSEQGELALINATPDGYKEHGRFKAIEGKTWNHPAMGGDVLLVRNSEEMAAYRLSSAVQERSLK